MSVAGGEEAEGPSDAPGTERSTESKYQKKLMYNDLLPYSELLEKEGNELFEQIKTNLSLAIQKSELWPGALFWTNRLGSFLRVYGLQMDKFDHVKLVKLAFNLVTIPNLESPLVRSWGYLFVHLLKKWKLLSRDDLSLPWQPMQELIKQVFHSKFKALGMRIYSISAQMTVHHVVSHARVYFPKEATQEILDKWLPYLCPFDMAGLDALTYMELLLPSVLPPESHDVGYRLWFEQLMKLWMGFPCPPSLNDLLTKLFVRLAKHNIGYIDWSPYMDQIFNRVLRSFQLPVGPKEFHAESVRKRVFFDSQKAASLIVSMMGSGSAALLNLTKLMKAVDSFYHPSNLGKHTKKLLVFLKELTTQFLLRLKKERVNKNIWYDFKPKSAYLTEGDIDMFVGCILPAARMATFSKLMSLDPALSLRNLAFLRPEMVLPDLLDRTYMALETLIEPHQLVAILQCVATVSRVLLSGGWGKYLEGRTHLFSLLTLALPGIDPNDYMKTLMSGMVISTLVTLVPLVDCSSAVGQIEMSEAERELCLMTSQFEDFVLQFLDRCFALVESTGLEQVASLDRMMSSVSSGNHESVMGMGTAGALHSILVQCSPSIFQVALEKLFHFATSSVFESEVSGRICADMCSTAAKVNAVETLKLFVPSCIRVISTVLEDPEQCELEHPDSSLIWNIQLLSQVLFGQGDALLPYAEQIISFLKSCVHLKCKSAASYAANALSNILHSLTMIYPTETRSIARDFSSPPEEHLYINDWSAPGNFKQLNLQWHEPNSDEMQMLDKLLHEFLEPEMNHLKAFVNGKYMDRDSLQQSLKLMLEILLGAGAYLPMLKGTQVDGCPSSAVRMEREDFISKTETWTPPQQFARESLAQLAHQLLDYVLRHEEDDTKTILLLVQIMKVLLMYPGIQKKEVDGKWKAFTHSKIVFEDKLHGKRGDIRPMMIARVHLQHEIRLLERSMSTTTESHLLILKDLFHLSVSAYTEIRIKAQTAFGDCLENYLYSGRKLFPSIVQLLLHGGHVSHEEFKGTLHLLLLPPVYKVFLHDWKLLSQTFQAIVQANPSEKPSILNLMSRIVKTIQMQYEFFTLQSKVPHSVMETAAVLHLAISDMERSEGNKQMNLLNQCSVRIYSEIVKDLVTLVESGQLQWRHNQIGATFLLLLVRHDHPYPMCGVKIMTDYLIHDTLAMRKVSIAAVSLILQQQKRKHVKVPVDISKEARVEYSSNRLPGERDDNKWLCYNTRASPQTKQEFDSFTFVDKTHWGYYCWPKTLYTYAPYDSQPPLNRRPEQIPESELPIQESFSSPEFISKLIHFLSLEESKGKDRFDMYKYHLFKGVCRNFGSVFSPLLKPHLEKMAVHHQENYQRCASEIIAGVVSGSKNWSYEMVSELKTFMKPLFSQILDVVAPETVEDWATCLSNISANRDPERLDWLLELLMTDPLPGNCSAFSAASRLYLLQSTLAQQEWRVPSLQHKLLKYINNHIAHSFKNVRERIGSVLSQIYLYETSTFCMKFNPIHADFLRILLKYSPGSTNKQIDGVTLKICKTGLQWLISSSENSRLDMFQVLISFLPLVTVDDDEEIIELIKKACARMSNAEFTSKDTPIIITYIIEALFSDQWRVKVPILHLIQVLVYENLFTFIEVESEVLKTLITLLENRQLEVRELASATLSGLLRCGYCCGIDTLKRTFVERARTEMPMKRDQLSSNIYEGFLVRRHSGVLGLAALVESSPYSVPRWLPEVLEEMAQHLYGPMTIQVTVKKAIAEFRRTHHDSWSEHKQKFEDDQLAILTELLISPSYYA